MIFGTLKLDDQDNYVYQDGSLPKAATWDKELLKAFVSKNCITVSAYDILPPSIQDKAIVCHGEPELAVKVSEIDALADIILVTRVTNMGQSGSKFRFNAFKRLVSTGQLEVWVRNV